MDVLVPKLTSLRVVAEAGGNFSDEHAAIHLLEHVYGPAHCASSFGVVATVLEGPVLLSAQS